jgi:hypothetical protein
MATTKKLQYRMYGFVPYNISEIQKGIQFGHAVVEYSIAHGKDEDYKSWAKNDKTFIILNGGTTNVNHGNMQSITSYLRNAGIKFATFNEEDLNNALSGIVFLVDNRVFDKHDFPVDDLERGFWEQVDEGFMPFEQLTEFTKKYTAYKQIVQNVGGIKNAFLRMFLDKYRLA